MNIIILHHRIGDLENSAVADWPLRLLHHRIGDLEMIRQADAREKHLHHRIGDLERTAKAIRAAQGSSSPHR